MSIGQLGQNIIFLISQPRAGSTLLQRILGNHPDIHTVSEPWLMLHPLYALRAEGHEAEFNAQFAQKALQGFLQTLPSGEEAYIAGVRQMYASLYKRALDNSGKRYFLDKTPRYYLIIPELYRTFPQAHYIILLRNPLAVLCSIFRSWVMDDGWPLQQFKLDLLKAPWLLLKGIELLEEQGVTVQYERLLGNPEGELGRICARLGVDFAPEMIEYGQHGLARWRFGDQKQVYRHDRPVSQNAEKWKQDLADPQVWRLANDYLHLLGRETFEQMYYPYEELEQVLGGQRPLRARQWLTLPLNRLLGSKSDVIRLKRSFQKRGVLGTAVYTGTERLKKARKRLVRMLPGWLREKLWGLREFLYTYWYLRRHDVPIVVYQIGKVGSTSVYCSLLTCDVKAAHLHQMKPAYVREMSKKDQVRIITLVREPISRQISGCFQNFKTWTGVDFKDANYSVEELCDIFISKNYQPPHWFDTEMRKMIGVDVYAYPFPKEKGYASIRQGRYEILILKTELDDAIKEEAISGFLGLDNFKLVRANMAQEKTYAETYQKFKQTIKLPKSFVERMLNARYTRHFYSEIEIEAMRAKYDKA